MNTHAATRIEEARERRENAWQAFLADVKENGTDWIREFLTDGAGPLALVLSDDDRMEVLQTSMANLDLFPFQMKYAARDAQGNLFTRHETINGKLHCCYRVDMQDLLTHRQAATIAKRYGHRVAHVTETIDTLIELVARKDLEYRLHDDEFLHKLWAAMREDEA